MESRHPRYDNRLKLNEQRATACNNMLASEPASRLRKL
ncbi:hypothetical protein EGR_07330 [Echinococcus granulosus]|uniref:Uncharacterized protein n=1 Tax=Echinococcus granulosus TaxID=6210 RepID=W6UWJ5_ECHGR|nr:hypothetical protein EGR_07330 [Echinococcus granulosus]EUB57859.1 hypothetical protein EGR_07330 [Echinococcus granulosus]